MELPVEGTIRPETIRRISSQHSGQDLAARRALPEETVATAGMLLNRGHENEGDVPRMEPAELDRRLRAREPVTVLDVRRLSQYDTQGSRIPGAIRMTVDEIPGRLGEIPKGRPIVLYCT